MSYLLQPTIDILEEIIRKSPKPLNQIFMKRAFPSIIEKTLKSDDEAIVQVSLIKMYLKREALMLRKCYVELVVRGSLN